MMVEWAVQQAERNTKIQAWIDAARKKEIKKIQKEQDDQKEYYHLCDGKSYGAHACCIHSNSDEMEM